VQTLSSELGVAEIAEGSPVGSFVAHVSVSDSDAGSSGRFTCALQQEDHLVRHWFALTPLTGNDDGEFQIRLVGCADFVP